MKINTLIKTDKDTKEVIFFPLKKNDIHNCMRLVNNCRSFEAKPHEMRRYKSLLELQGRSQAKNEMLLNV